MVGFVLFIIFVVGLFWLATSPNQTVGLTLSFVAGLSMIFLPCTLPLAFVIVPMTLGKDPIKGLNMAISFGLGLTITLSFYGVFIAALGKTFGLKSDAEVYAVLLGGAVAFLFGLSEIGLLKFKLPSYSGKFPDFIQHQKDYVKTFLLGLLLGNAGVGCPNPAFYLLLGYIATTGDLFNGWFLGFVHGLGRAVPLIFLAILGTLGVNALSGVARHKETVERAMGWMLTIIGSYLLTFGIFGHDWFIASGIHGAWEQFVSRIGGHQFGEVVLKHEHVLVDIPNFIQYGNMFFLGILALTILIAFVVKRPSRQTMVSLAVIYALIVLAIGYSTGGTFRIGANMHIQFKGTTVTPGGGDGAHNAHGSAVYHEEADVRKGVAVNLNVSPIPVLSREVSYFPLTQLDFFVNQKPGNIPIPYTLLQEEHTKLMHVIGVRNDMNEFFHIHPTNKNIDQEGVLRAYTIFNKSGLYKIWSEIKKDDVNHAFGHPEINVQGTGEKYKKEVSFARNIIVENHKVSLTLDEPVAKQKETDLEFDIHTLDGKEIDVENYLGATMHLTLIKDDWKQFIHTHPEGDGQHMMDDQHTMLNIVNTARAHGNEELLSSSEDQHGINFHVTFPEAGLYKAFAQFRPQGSDLPPDEALMVSFWIEVGEQAPLFSGWWWYLIVSVVLMGLLSWGVKKYLTGVSQV